LLDVEVTVGTVHLFLVGFLGDRASFVIDLVVEAEGGFFLLVVNGVTSLPSTRVDPDAVEVFLIGLVVEAEGGDFLLVVTGVTLLPSSGVFPDAVEVD
jgi:hypothetical protein